MARARNLKPGFFTNDRLAECEPLARLLFAGLWTIADREGRLEDRPRRIKAELLPYDDCDVESLLSELACRGFILRYEAVGTALIQVINFPKHQTPHVKEAESQWPGPGEHQTSTVQASDLNGASTPVSISLNPLPVSTTSSSSTHAPARDGARGNGQTTTTTEYEKVIGDETLVAVRSDFARISPNLSPTWLRTALAKAPPGIDRPVLLSALDRTFRQLEETAKSNANAPPDQRIRNWPAFGRRKVLEALNEVANGR